MRPAPPRLRLPIEWRLDRGDLVFVHIRLERVRLRRRIRDRPPRREVLLCFPPLEEVDAPVLQRVGAEIKVQAAREGPGPGDRVAMSLHPFVPYVRADHHL